MRPIDIHKKNNFFKKILYFPVRLGFGYFTNKKTASTPICFAVTTPMKGRGFGF